jgi:hypothetical protein
LIRRVKSPKRLLGDKAYDSAELRENLNKRGTKPVIPRLRKVYFQLSPEFHLQCTELSFDRR